MEAQSPLPMADVQCEKEREDSAAVEPRARSHLGHRAVKSGLNFPIEVLSVELLAHGFSFWRMKVNSKGSTSSR